MLESEEESEELTRDHLSELLEERELELELELLEELPEEWWSGDGLRLFLDENLDCDAVLALDLDATL